MISNQVGRINDSSQLDPGQIAALQASLAEVAIGQTGEKFLTPLNTTASARALWESLSNVKLGIGSLGAVGDSLLEGYTATNKALYSWYSLVKFAVFGPLGENCADSESISSFGGAIATDLGIGYTGSVAVGTKGPNKSSVIIQAGSTMTFTGLYEFLGFYHYRAAGQGTVTIKINGSTIVSVDCSGATAFDVLAYPATTGGASASDVYTLEVSVASVEITGLIRLQGASGNRIHINRFALAGTATGNQDAASALSLATQNGFFGNAVGGQVLLCCYGTNDIYNPATRVTAATFEANYRSFLDVIRAYSPGTKLVFVVPSIPNPASWDTISGQSHEGYVAAIHRISDDYAAGIIDLTEIDFIGLSFLNADGLHYNDAGHAAVAQKIISELPAAISATYYPTRILAKYFRGISPNGNIGGEVSAYTNGVFAYMSGCHYNGSNFVADATSAGVMQYTGGAWVIYGDSGLTIGSTFNPTLRMGIGANGTVDLGAAVVSNRLEIYHSGNIHYGFGMAAGQIRHYFASDGTLVMGDISTSDGTTFTARHIFSPTGGSIGGTFTLPNAGTPSSASDTGVQGRISWDSSYIYVCVATNTWKRVAISTW